MSLRPVTHRCRTLPAFALLGFGAFGLAGCGSTSQLFPDTATLSNALTGRVHGGQQPISGALIRLYAAGTAGDGSASKSLLTQPVHTDANGDFKIAELYTCEPGMMVYLTATGGNPGLTGTNKNLALMVALGPCADLEKHPAIAVNELTTVAGVSALAPYMKRLDAIGTSTYHVSSFASAFNYATQLVDPATATSPGRGPFSARIAPTHTLNTLGNILATCINSAGGKAGDPTPCGHLFALTTVPKSTMPGVTSNAVIPTDTVGAALVMTEHPTLNAPALFAMATSTAPFQPTLSIAPPSLAVTLAVEKTTAITTYHSYGASITEGYTLHDPQTQAYPAIFASANHLRLGNYGISGALACDIAALEIFPHADSPVAAAPMLYTLLVGTNDVWLHGPGSYEAIFNSCQQASVSWLAVPREHKVMGASTTVKTSGATHVETGPMHARFTDAHGATLSIPFQESIAAPLYVWYRIDDDSTGTFTYAVDGVVLGSLTSSLGPGVKTRLGTESSVGLLRIPQVAAGPHTFSVTQTSHDAAGAGIVAIATLPPPGAPGKSRVLVGTITTEGPGPDTDGPCVSTFDRCRIFNDNILANVNLFAGDGLDVELFNPSKYLTNTTADMSDTLHPNALGQQEIAHALQDAYKP